MALDRGALARIDRRVFVELDHSDGSQVVKVPVSDAVWSTWRRYCDALGMTMGQAVAGLITHELAAIVDQAIEDPTFDLESACKEREERLDAQARDLEEELVREREARLRR